MSRISGLRNDMYKRTFYKERKINNICFDLLSKQIIIAPLILGINENIMRIPCIEYDVNPKIYVEGKRTILW